MTRPLLVYTTFPNAEMALAVGETLVRDGLAACVNVLPETRSVYMWKGEVERGVEAIAIVKTRADLRNAVGSTLRHRHPYETPVIFFIEPDGADAETLAWLAAETQPDGAT